MDEPRDRPGLRRVWPADRSGRARVRSRIRIGRGAGVCALSPGVPGRVGAASPRSLSVERAPRGGDLLLNGARARKGPLRSPVPALSVPEVALQDVDDAVEPRGRSEE